MVCYGVRTAGRLCQCMFAHNATRVHADTLELPIKSLVVQWRGTVYVRHERGRSGLCMLGWLEAEAVDLVGDVLQPER
jgi:hypothetical protein